VASASSRFWHDSISAGLGVLTHLTEDRLSDCQDPVHPKFRNINQRDAPLFHVQV
jgi:hypothetical protein